MWRWIIRGILFVVLVVLVVHHYHSKPSVGLPVNIVTTECGPQGDETVVMRRITLVIGTNGQMKINDRPVASQNLAETLRLIYETRYERVLFLDGIDQASFQDVANAIDIAKTAVPNLRVLVITPSVRDDCENQIRFYIVPQR